MRLNHYFTSTQFMGFYHECFSTPIHGPLSDNTVILAIHFKSSCGNYSKITELAEKPLLAPQRMKKCIKNAM